MYPTSQSTKYSSCIQNENLKLKVKQNQIMQRSDKCENFFFKSDTV